MIQTSLVISTLVTYLRNHTSVENCKQQIILKATLIIGDVRKVILNIVFHLQVVSHPHYIFANSAKIQLQHHMKDLVQSLDQLMLLAKVGATLIVQTL